MPTNLTTDEQVPLRRKIVMKKIKPLDLHKTWFIMYSGYHQHDWERAYFHSHENKMADLPIKKTQTHTILTSNNLQAFFDFRQRLEYDWSDWFLTHYDSNKPRIETKVLGHSLDHSLLRSHHSLIHLICTACFAALICSLTPSQAHGKANDVSV